MQALFGFLLILFIVLLILGIFNPNKALFWFNGKKDRTNVFKIYGIGFIISFLCIGVFAPKQTLSREVNNTVSVTTKDKSDSKNKTTHDSIQNDNIELIVEERIPFKILRNWSPDKDNSAIGMDILINDDFVSEESIKQLINQIVNSQVKKANVLIFTSEKAWKEVQSGTNNTDDSSKNYIAFYIKNLSSDDNGFNEIRWMQEIGVLSDKYGGKTKL